ncbi:hypothetical protein MRX96_039405 [Rhipicephalus microplus]
MISQETMSPLVTLTSDNAVAAEDLAAAESVTAIATAASLTAGGFQPRQLKESSTQTLSAGLSPTFTLLPGMDTKMRLRERGLQRHEVKDSSTQTWFDCPLGKSFKPAGSAAMMRLLERE